ncbi:MAG: DUF4011 domain-containing protein [Akkermansia sp.]|nr:DUF4011 domain-containing protein [Akkermansia sp.]
MAEEAEVPAQKDEDRDMLVTVKPRSRMENWQFKLLDLSLRNNLLNAKMDGTRQIRLVLPNVGALEDALADGKGFRFVPTEDAAAPPDAAALFKSQKLVGCKNDADLCRSLQTLYKNARTELEESGANTLYLACGFLRWYRKDMPEKPLLAPILLIPAALTRASVKDGYTLRGFDEDTRINLTLLQFLKTEYGMRIPELEGDLPADASGVDVPAVFGILRRAVEGLDRWEVLEDCSLGCYSFTKYLMWKDLVDRQQDLLRNPVVAQIANSQRGRFPEQVPFPPPATLDAVDPSEVLVPMSSDSSQLSAIMAAEQGKSFVLIGPPGTGKSQSITNLIAHCLGHGKTVLFVAEKAAALNVVFKRLKKIGLGSFCMQLHSGKANKKEAFLQIKAAMAAANSTPEQQPWGDTVRAMQDVRNILNDIPLTLGGPQADGGTLYGDIDLLALHAGIADIAYPAEKSAALTAEERRAMLDSAHELSLRFKLVADAFPGPAQDLRATECDTRREEQLADTLQRFAAGDAAWEQAFDALAQQLECPADDAVRASLRAAAVYALRTPALDNTALLPTRAWKTLQTLGQMLPHAEAYRAGRAQLSAPYAKAAMLDAELPGLLDRCRRAQDSNGLVRWWVQFTTRRHLKKLIPGGGAPDCLNDLAALVQMQPEYAALQDGADTLPPYLRATTDLTADHLAAAERTARALQGIGPMEENAALLMQGSAPHASGPALSDLQRQMQLRDALLDELSSQLGTDAKARDFSHAGEAAEWANALLALRPRWRDLAGWNAEAAKARSLGNAPLVDALEGGAVPAEDAETALLVNLARARIRLLADTTPQLNSFSPRLHDARIDDFCQKDEALMSCAKAHVCELLTQRAATYAEDATELSILQHEMNKQRGQMPLRRLLLQVPGIMRKLKPCWLMSPLSVAQYLSTETEPFDLVVFDEASQIPVWDAIGVIGRGKNAVIVGDPRQMPPTSFFSRSRDDDSDEEAAEQDLESILDECRACGIPEMKLAWHFRSKSESLIAFSNMKYYDGELTTFPAPVTGDTALQYHFTGGTYIPGSRKRINPTEARALVDHVLQTLRAPGFRYTENTSIGIVTFNMQQQAYIEDLLDEERAKDPSLEPFFADTNPEAVFIKNLENVQGDERGVIYFSTTYGHDEEGKMSMNFGPLNLAGGERRLNVAVTRARCGLHVFTSMAPEDIDLTRTAARGAADLRDFLDYAKRGAAAYMASKAPAGGGVSGLTQAVARDLEELGWKCHPNVGISSFHISLGVEDPRTPGAMLAGIMLDGTEYAAANTARDRDVLRPSVLEGLGWHILHAWALDWWRNPQECIRTLDSQLRDLAQREPEPPAELPSLIDSVQADTPAAAPQQEVSRDQLLKVPYMEYEPQDAFPNPETASDFTLRQFVVPLVQREAPLTLDFLCERICQLTGANKLNKEATERVKDLVKACCKEGDFAAKREKGADGTQHTLLIPAGEDAPKVLIRARGPRHWRDIPISEYKELAKHLLKDLQAEKGTKEHLDAIAAFYDVTPAERRGFDTFIRQFI